LVKNKALGLLGLTSAGAVSQARYYLALSMLLGWLVLTATLSYTGGLDTFPMVSDYGRWVLLVADLLLIFAVFFVGGDPLIRKFAALFEWDNKT